MMKLFKIVYLIYWCCSVFTLQSAQLDENEIDNNIEEKIEKLKSIANTGIWSENIIFVNILFYGKMTNVIQSLQFAEKTCHLNISKKSDTNNNQIPNDSSTCKLCKQKLFYISKSMYTALGCKYSDLILQLLQLYFNGETYNYFRDLKKHVSKMIYNLLAFINNYPNLKFFNQDLLLSLISIIIYLPKNNEIDEVNNEYYDNENWMINDNKLVIARTINLIERSRCENCIVLDNDYNLYDTTDSNLKLDNLSKTLEKYTKTLTFESQYLFDEDMYSIVNMTLEHIFQISPIIQTFIVKWNNTFMEMQKVADDVKKTSYITDVLDYQMLLIDVLKSIFCQRFLKMDNLPAFQDELNIFDTFIHQIIPINYPSNLYNSIIQIRKSVINDIGVPMPEVEKKQKRHYREYIKNKILFRNKNNTDKKPKESLALTEETKKILDVNNAIYFKENSPYVPFEKIDMSDLITRVVEYKYFNIFLQMFTLLLNTPKYELESYNFNTFKNLQSDFNNLSFNKDICKKLPPLRENLFLFRSVIAAVQANYMVEEINGPESSILLSMEAIKRNLAFISTHFNNQMDYSEIKNIFIPITSYFKDASYSIFECIIVKQYLLLTINLIESYEINICHSINEPIKFNLVMFKELLNDKNMYRVDVPENVKSPANFNTNYLCGRIVDNTTLYEHFMTSHDEIESYSLSWVNKFLPNSYFNYYDEEFDSGFVFWNGNEKHINDVSLSITQSVINVYHIIKYQIFCLKSMIYYVFKKMLYIAHHMHRFLSENDTNTLLIIKRVLKKFSCLTFPSTIHINVKTTIENYMQIFQNNLADKISIIVENMKEQMSQLEITKMEDTNESFFESTKYNLDRILNSLINDLKCTLKLLYLMTESKIIPVDKINYLDTTNSNNQLDNDFFLSLYEYY